MVKRKSKGGQKAMDTGAEEEHPVYSYGGAAEPTGIGKKKKKIKLSRKQILRKQQKQDRGETLTDRREKKAMRDARKLDQKIAARAMW
jgi:hypothetical protein